jgi:hypothetical protein
VTRIYQITRAGVAHLQLALLGDIPDLAIDKAGHALKDGPELLLSHRAGGRGAKLVKLRLQLLALLLSRLLLRSYTPRNISWMLNITAKPHARYQREMVSI